MSFSNNEVRAMKGIRYDSRPQFYQDTLPDVQEVNSML
jgi:hypothetical protein